MEYRTGPDLRVYYHFLEVTKNLEPPQGAENRALRFETDFGIQMRQGYVGVLEDALSYKIYWEKQYIQHGRADKVVFTAYKDVEGSSQRILIGAFISNRDDEFRLLQYAAREIYFFESKKVGGTPWTHLNLLWFLGNDNRPRYFPVTWGTGMVADSLAQEIRNIRASRA
ncbi:hypothetical protein C8Q76DRAFT_802594 [Earliella scabrosa]|nr:hypothetical protein C8Q76DRAFT_802594 [Earliella scabrosa]